MSGIMLRFGRCGVWGLEWYYPGLRGCCGFMCPGFGSGRATGVVSVRTCQQLVLCQSDPRLTHQQWWQWLWATNLKRSYCRGVIVAGERCENMSGEQPSTLQGRWVKHGDHGAEIHCSLWSTQKQRDAQRREWPHGEPVLEQVFWQNQGRTHAGAVCVRTVTCGRDPCWRRSLRSVPWERH